MKGKIRPLRAAGREGILYVSPGEGERALLVACCGDEIEGMLPTIAEALEPLIGKTVRPFALSSLPDVDWDADYTPWPCDELPGRAMTGGADALLDYLQGPFLAAAREALPDAAETGIQYGKLCAYLYSAYAVLRHYIRFRRADLDIRPDFLAEEDRWELSLKARLTPLIVLAAALRMGASFVWKQAAGRKDGPPGAPGAKKEETGAAAARERSEQEVL